VHWKFNSGSVGEARESRHEFRSILQTHGCDDSDFDAAETIFGELVGNVVRHAHGPVDITLDWDAPYPVLIVRDETDHFVPTFTLPFDDYAEGGRGLFMVKVLARSVRVTDIAGDGTELKAELPVSKR
jgi:anti-sigma regulatory factor (Ser/Thr protein kinase)